MMDDKIVGNIGDRIDKILASNWPAMKDTLMDDGVLKIAFVVKVKTVGNNHKVSVNMKSNLLSVADKSEGIAEQIEMEM